MESNIIFLDTSVFVKKGYLLGNSLSRIAQFSKHGHIELIICDIVYNELISKMERDINAASIEFQKDISHISSKCRIYKNFPRYQSIFDLKEPSQDKEEDFNDLKKRFDDFLQENLIKTIPVSDTSVKTIFDSYFKGKAPFNEANKKFEFPDAFILSTYEKYCKDHKSKGFIISYDGDITSYESENLIMINNIEEINEKLSKKYDIQQFQEQEQQDWQKLAKDWWDKAWSTVNMRQNIIQKDLENELIKLIVSDLYSKKSLITYEVLKINDINIEINLPFKGEEIGLDSEAGTIHLESTATVSIDVDIADRSKGYYNDETDKWIGEQIISKNAVETISFEVDVNVIHTPENPSEKPSYRGFENLEYCVELENFGLW
ncbi:MAG: PIN domain-containing protein [Bacteroidales bacterium]|nr:PIN domain-containing protein [Bacteroidales bacterium]